MSQTDEELMVLVAQKDKKAFGLIVRRYLYKAETYAKRFTKLESFEDEIIQDIFLRVWKYAPKWDLSKGLFKSWFCSLAIKTCCSYAKRHKRHLFNTDNLETIPDSECNIENVFIKHQESTALMKKISYLNKREQQVILLRYFEELSNEETAKIIGSTTKAVESLLIRAKEKLRKFCEKEKKNGQK